MGIKVLLLVFAIVLVFVNIALYILVNELEAIQQEVRDLSLRYKEVRGVLDVIQKEGK